MPSVKFGKIKTKLQSKHPIYAKYDGERNPRKLCPYVLGYKKENSAESDGNERVLCYQLEGPDPNSGWRCFDVSKLEIVDPAPPEADWEDRPEYTAKWQNGVQKVKHKV